MTKGGTDTLTHFSNSARIADRANAFSRQGIPMGCSPLMHDRMGAWHHDPLLPPHPDSFGARSTLAVNGRDYEIFRLTAPALTSAHDVARLPYSIKVVLENLLRHEDGLAVSAGRHRGRGRVGQPTRAARLRK